VKKASLTNETANQSMLTTGDNFNRVNVTSLIKLASRVTDEAKPRQKWPKVLLANAQNKDFRHDNTMTEC
jgi:hypothetical protein